MLVHRLVGWQEKDDDVVQETDNHEVLSLVIIPAVELTLLMCFGVLVLSVPTCSLHTY